PARPEMGWATMLSGRRWPRKRALDRAGRAFAPWTHAAVGPSMRRKPRRRTAAGKPPPHKEVPMRRAFALLAVLVATGLAVIGKIAGRLFPVHWNSLTTAEGDIAWTPGTTEASATLDGGQTAEVQLKMFKGMKGQQVLIKNLPYWGAPRNDGFIVMPNTTNAMRKGEKAFDSHGTNGFMITFDIDEKTAPPAMTGM